MPPRDFARNWLFLQLILENAGGQEWDEREIGPDESTWPHLALARLKFPDARLRLSAQIQQHLDIQFGGFEHLYEVSLFVTARGGFMGHLPFTSTATQSQIQAAAKMESKIASASLAKGLKDEMATEVMDALRKVVKEMDRDEWLYEKGFGSN
ncbi:hypothetical protein BC830DRAFT_1086165 [Chytriomyces sp. MP71]|nr:hypothetical protein BC830DRAFT_1086165 [Chytriomyces sp. MP71]